MIKQSFCKRSTVLFVPLAVFCLLLASCARTPVVQRSYGAPTYIREAEEFCANKYGIETTTQVGPSAGSMIGGMGAGAGAGVLAFIFPPAAIVMLAAVPIAESARNKTRADQENQISSYQECVQEKIAQHHTNYRQSVNVKY